jgi:hypothetical protein
MLYAQIVAPQFGQRLQPPAIASGVWHCGQAWVVASPSAIGSLEDLLYAAAST